MQIVYSLASESSRRFGEEAVKGKQSACIPCEEGDGRVKQGSLRSLEGLGATTSYSAPVEGVGYTSLDMIGRASCDAAMFSLA